MKAPLVALVAYDTRFYEHLPRMFHNPDGDQLVQGQGRVHRDQRVPQRARLQGAYLILALRAVGLDCGAMSGFDNAKVDAAFFPDGRLKSNFLINIGYGTGKGTAAAQPAPHLRGGLPDPLTGRAPRSSNS